MPFAIWKRVPVTFVYVHATYIRLLSFVIILSPGWLSIDKVSIHSIWGQEICLRERERERERERDLSVLEVVEQAPC